jgi:hypothetical protein
VASLASNVLLDDAGQGASVTNVGDPAGELAVPEEGVATKELAVLRRPLGSLVSIAEGEGTLGGLHGIPLHAVLWGDLAEICLEDGYSTTVGESTRVGDVAQVELALRDEGLIDAVRATSRASNSAR